MRHLYLLLIALCLAFNTASAQDARQRTTQTIVQDILALMPIQQKTDFDREMKDVAEAAPATVEMLCQMLQPAEKAVNNKVEYALSGVVNYAAEHPACKAKVLEALKASAPKAADETARQFILSQARLLDPQSVPVTYVEHVGAKPYAQQWDALQQNAEKVILKTIKSGDRALRMQALKYATDHQLATDALAAKVVKQYKKAPAEAKEDILNWLGDNHITSQQSLMLAEMNGTQAKAAIEALGKMGSEEAATALVGQLGGELSQEAQVALRSFTGDLSALVCEKLKTEGGKQQDELLMLAANRRLHATSSQVLALSTKNDKALQTLPFVVTKEDAETVASLLDKAGDKQVAPLQEALYASLKQLQPAEQFAVTKVLMAKATNANRFYKVLARGNTDESVAMLQNEYTARQNGEALDALKQSKNYKAARALWTAVTKADDQSALFRYAQLVNDNEGDKDNKVTFLSQALNHAKEAGTKKTILDYIGNIPTLPAFTTASHALDDKAVAYEAAYACKKIAGKAAADIDYNNLQQTLTRASEIIKAHGLADDGYALDEIKKMLSEAKPVPPTVLSDEEVKEGFELLFDGTNLDKWQGNKTGYVPVNGTIFVTANYGNEGNLYTVKEYKDFVFRFEFCFVRPGINNGVGIRTPMNVDAAYDAMCECQILDHDDPIYAGLREYQVHGSVYGVIPAKRIKHKPLGEWSTEEIRVKGNHITVTVNGEVIVDGDVKEACKGHNVAPDGKDVNPYTVDHKNHPGMFNKKGFISFCGHGPGLKLRNIRVKELK